MNETILEYSQDFHNKIICGDCIDVMRQMPDEVVQCCPTSPPFWGLRDYGLEPIIWDGDPECPHKWSTTDKTIAFQNNLGNNGSFDRSGVIRDTTTVTTGFCQHCGAWLGSLGLEPTPELYIDHLVQIFREVWRVLRKDGTLWVNIGDSYAGNKTGSQGDKSTLEGGKATQITAMQRPDKMCDGLKPKDLVLIPFRLALALQADGWWIRSDIIWAKNNPMPESVRDRPTKAHEYVFLCTKSGKSLYWTHRDRDYSDGTYKQPKPEYRWYDKKNQTELTDEPEGWKDATFLPTNLSLYGNSDQWGKVVEPILRYSRVNLWSGHDYYYNQDAIAEPIKESSLQRISQKTFDTQKGGAKDYRHGINPNRSMRTTIENFAKNNKGTRNKRTVWTVNTKPSSIEHYASFPEKLIEPMILAGSKPGDIVLDPFMGAGTTGVVAKKLGRRWIGIDASPEYCPMAERRIRDTVQQPDLPMMGGGK